MHLQRILLWSLGVGLLAGLAMGTAPATAGLAEIAGTVVVFDDGEGDVSVFILADDGEYLASGGKVAELKEHAGKSVTAKGAVSENEFGELRIELQEFTVGGD